MGNASGQTSTQPPMLAVNGLGKSFGAFRAVDAVTLTVEQHEVKAVIGPNGAGKSTLFSCLAGTLRQSDGMISFNGEDVTHLPVHRRVQRGMVKSFQTTSIFADMTVEDNILTAAVAVAPWSAVDMVTGPWRRLQIRSRVSDALAAVRLEDKRTVQASALSHGDQRKLEIGIAIACSARLLLLDEPTAGMGVDDIKEFFNLVDRIRRSCGILLVEHNMDIVLGVSDRIIVLDQGRVIAEGTPDDVRRDPVVRNAYLGRREL